MVVGLLGNKSSDSNRFTLVTPKSENDVRLQAKLGNQNLTGLPVGAVSIPKGNKVIIGADGLAHHIKNGMMQPLAEDSEVKGYDARGISEYLYTHLRNRFEIDEMLENYDDTKEKFIEEIEYALSDIGF